MLKKIKHSFWWGFVFGMLVTFVYFYIVWPRPALDTELINGTKVILPKAGAKAGIYFPQDGDKVTGVFIVYGIGAAFENAGGVEVTDVNDQTLLSVPVYFQATDPSQSGPFIALLNLAQVKNLPENGKVNLYATSLKDGKKIIIDSKNVRFQ